MRFNIFNNENYITIGSVCQNSFFGGEVFSILKDAYVMCKDMPNFLLAF